MIPLMCPIYKTFSHESCQASLMGSFQTRPGSPQSKISVLRSKNPCQLAGNFAAQDNNFSLLTPHKVIITVSSISCWLTVLYMKQLRMISRTKGMRLLTKKLKQMRQNLMQFGLRRSSVASILRYSTTSTSSSVRFSAATSEALRMQSVSFLRQDVACTKCYP